MEEFVDTAARVSLGKVKSFASLVVHGHKVVLRGSQAHSRF